MRSEPSDEELKELREKVAKVAGTDVRYADNLLFTSYFTKQGGLFNPNRREWIERYFTIKPKAASLQLLKLNPVQRRLHGLVERMKRLGIPVRVIILKARQAGISTDVQAIMFEEVLREKNRRGLIVADTDDRAEMLLRIANTARKNMPKHPEGDVWNFRMDSRAAYQLAWSDPINGSIEITSSQTSGAGRGGTLDVLHLTETAFWRDAAEQAVGILESLPDLPGTMAFNESTANGDSGWFRDEFWRSWEERHVPLMDRKSSWVALFIAWWEHDEYRWTRTFGVGRTLPPSLVMDIHKTLDEEEEWLLTQKYFVRGVGWKNVDYDQLAWRRKKIADYSGKGGRSMFDQEHPSRPEVAFMASGAKVFDAEKIQRMLREVRPPVWRGTLEDPSRPLDHAEPAVDEEHFQDQILPA